MKLRIVQHNYARDAAVMAQMQQLLIEQCVDVALILEPMGYRTISVPNGYQVFSSHGRHGTPYAAVIAKSSLSPMKVHNTEEINGACVSLNWGGSDLFVAAVYCQWRGSMDPYVATMRIFIEFAAGRPLIMGLDANASSLLWHSKPLRGNSNRSWNRGLSLEEFIDTDNLTVLNRRSEHYTLIGRGRSRCSSDVDVTLANNAWTSTFQVHGDCRFLQQQATTI